MGGNQAQTGKGKNAIGRLRVYVRRMMARLHL